MITILANGTVGLSEQWVEVPESLVIICYCQIPKMEWIKVMYVWKFF